MTRGCAGGNEWGSGEIADDPAIVEALIEAGADPDARNTDGWTSLHVAARYATDPAVAMALIEAGADPKARTDEGDRVWSLLRENDALRETAFYERLLRAALMED